MNNIINNRKNRIFVNKAAFWKPIFLFFVWFISVISNSSACTTILVGKEATTDGSQFIARNEDFDPIISKILLLHNAKNNSKKTFKSNDNKFSYPLPEKALAYSSFASAASAQNIEDLTFGSVGFNELGVAMSATETVFASEKALKNDPYLPKTGITEDSIVDIVLPYIRSAKEGVLRLGKIVEEKGAGEGFGVSFLDQDGIWYFETGSAHRWMARKIPSDKYYVSGNQNRLTDYDPKDPDNYLGSEDLIQYAEKNGLYNKAKDGKFNFSKAYALFDNSHKGGNGTNGKKGDHYYNYPRVFALQKLFTNGTKIELSKPEDFPVFETPSKKLSLEDVKKGMRNTYENLNKKVYTEQPDTEIRPISLFRTDESHILQIKSNLPAEVANIEYVAYGMPSISIYLPVYVNGITDLPMEYKYHTQNVADSSSAYWAYRKLQTLAMLNYYKYAPIIQKRYAKLEKSFAERQQTLEKDYQKTYATNPEKAKKLIDIFQTKVFSEALTATEELTNEIFTDLVIELNKKYKFSGA